MRTGGFATAGAGEHALWRADLLQGFVLPAAGGRRFGADVAVAHSESDGARPFGDHTFDRILDRFSAMAGRRLVMDEAVYESERRTGHRNRAIAHLLLNFDLVHDQAEAALDVYFKQCSILVTTRDLATMAATLAMPTREPPRSPAAARSRM